MSQTDVAVQKQADDELDRVKFCQSVAKVLIGPGSESASGVVLGLTGPWGSGKTSILNMVQEELSGLESEPIVVSFQPWITSGLQDLVLCFLQELKVAVDTRARIEDSNRESLQKVSDALKDYAVALGTHGSLIISAFDPTAGAAVAASSGFFGWRRSREPPPRELTIDEHRNNLRNRVNELGRPVIVVIDEIDRLTDQEVISMAQLIKAVVYFENISFLLAYDADRVSKAFGHSESGSGGREYLEKIVQYELAIPYLHPHKVRSVLLERLEKSSVAHLLPRNWQGDQDFMKMIELVVPFLVQNVRDITRLVNAFSVTHEMVGDEVYWVDALAFHALEQKKPEVASRIRHAPWKVASDPSYAPEAEFEHEMLRSIDRDKEMPGGWRAEILGQESENVSLVKLIEFLFPAVRDDKSRDSRHEYTDRLMFDRALTSLLQLGLSTGEVSFNDVQEKTTADYTGQLEFLEQIDSEFGLIPFVDRFADVQDRIERSTIENVWRAIAKYADKTLNAPESDPQYLNLFVSNQLIRRWDVSLDKDPRLAGNVTGFAGQLMSDGSIEFLSALLFGYVHEHGLFGWRKQNELGPYNLSESSTLSMSQQWGATVADLLTKEEKIRGLRSPQPLFLAIDSGQWIEKHRLLFGDLLRSEDAIDSTILCLFGGSQRVDKSFMTKLVDFESLKSAMEIRLHNMISRERVADLRKTYEKVWNHLGF